MRLVTRTIWRAFPELDRFEDERCARFVSGAKRSRSVPRRLLWWLGQGASTLPVFLTAAAAIVLLQRWSQDGYNDLGKAYTAITLQGVVTVLAAAGALLVWIGVGHWFLRRRVTWVLRARGRCASCGYTLVGLPVSSTFHVVCPECQLDGEVDPSLGELSNGADGVPRYTPSEEMLGRSRPWLTRERLWKWTKKTAMAAAVLLVVAGAWWGWHEWSIAAQARRAAALKPGATGLTALMEQAQLSGAAPDATNGYDLLRPLSAKMNKAQADLFPNGLPLVPGMNIYLEGTWVAQRPWPGETKELAAERLTNEPYSLQLLQEFEKRGVFADMKAMVDAPLAIGAMNQTRDQPLFNLVLGEYPLMRKLARWNGGRMRLAVRNDDPARFADALDSTLGLSRMLEKQPVLIARLVAVAIESLAYGELRAAITERHDARWLDAYERVLKKYQAHGSRTLPYEGERVFSKDIVCWVFADTARTRLGKYSPALRQAFALPVMGGNVPDGRLGTLDENLAAFDAFYDEFEARARQPRWQRSAAAGGAAAAVRSPFGGPPKPRDQTDLVLVNLLAPGIGNSLRAQDQVEVDRAATTLLIALERFKLENGAYPQTLAELTPRWVPAAVIDPWTGMQFAYRTIDPSKDTQGRGFLLYSVGADLTDNGGLSAPSAWDALHGRAPGTDYIINDDKR
jgi:hypothetical protein